MVTRKSDYSSIVLKIVLSIILVFVIAISVLKITEHISMEKSTFPRLEISLREVPIETINAESKDVKYPHNTVALTINNINTIYDNVEVKGRGNYTWNQIKKPYQIKFNERINLLDLNKPAKKWLLLANYTDHTHLRNDLAFYLERLLKEPYALNGNFAELYIDNYYNGLYYITEKAEIDKSRISLKDDLGIIAELDNIYGGAEGCYSDLKGNCLTIKDTLNEDLADSSMQSLVSSLNHAETAIELKDYSAVTELIDIDSFARYYLLNEFSANPDAYTTSFFLYKDGESDKIHAGPGWDFDISFGYIDWNPTNTAPEVFHSPFQTNPLKTYVLDRPEASTMPISTLVYDLLDFPEFSQKVQEIYQNTLSGHGEELLDYIKAKASYIKDAAYRDQARWKYDTDFYEETDYLIDWVAKRYHHFEELYESNQNTDQFTSPETPTTEDSSLDSENNSETN